MFSLSCVWDPGGWRSGAGLPMVYEHDSYVECAFPMPTLGAWRGLGEELVAPRGIPGHVPAVSPVPHTRSVFPTSKGSLVPAHARRVVTISQ